MQGRIAFIFIAICLFILACNSEPDYISLERGISVEVEVLSLRYKKGVDSAQTAKPSLRYFDVDVVHTRDTFYTIWQEKVRAISVSDPGLSELELMMQTPIYAKGLKAEYSLYEDGILGNLLNWPEIKTFVDSSSWEYMAQFDSDQKMLENYQMIIQQYNTQQIIESKMFKCVSIFHTPYGLYTDTSDTGRQRVFDIDMLINPVEEQLVWYHKDDHVLYFLCVYPETKTNIGQTFLQPFAAVGMPDSILEYASQISFTDTLYCDFNIEESRLNSAQFSRTLQLKSDTFIEIIELKVFPKGAGSD